MIVARSIILGVRGHLVHRFSEWVFSAIMAAFASSLLAPGSTFATSHAYDYMASWMGECAWGYMLLAVAMTRFTALAINGTFRQFRPFSPMVRTVTAWMSSASWACLSLSMYNGNPVGTGWRVYGVLAVSDLCLSFVIANEAGRVYQRHVDGPGEW